MQHFRDLILDLKTWFPNEIKLAYQCWPVKSRFSLFKSIFFIHVWLDDLIRNGKSNWVEFQINLFTYCSNNMTFTICNPVIPLWSWVWMSTPLIRFFFASLVSPLEQAARNLQSSENPTLLKRAFCSLITLCCLLHRSSLCPDKNKKKKKKNSCCCQNQMHLLSVCNSIWRSA